MNVVPTAAAVWAERTCEVTSDAVQKFSTLNDVDMLSVPAARERPRQLERAEGIRREPGSDDHAIGGAGLVLRGNGKFF